MWNYKSSSVVLVIVIAHKSFPALAEKWTRWPARSFPSLLHECLCWSPAASLLLPPPEPAGLRERICLSVTRRAHQVAVSCVLAQETSPSILLQPAEMGLSITRTHDCLEIAGLCDDLGIIALCFIVCCCPLNLKCRESKVWQFWK